MRSKSKLHRREFLAVGGGAALASFFSGKAVAAISCVDAKPVPNRDRPQAAVSLRETIKLLQAGKPPIFESITRLDGYAIDDANNDIALFGMVEPGQPPLRIDDFAIALRSAFTRGDDYKLSPAISLDPDDRFFEALNRIKTTTAEGRRRYEKQCRSPHWQTVRVDGMPRHTRVAKALVDADFRMKQVSQGVAKVPGVPGISGDFAEILRTWRAALNAGQEPDVAGRRMRYWFTPGRFEYGEAADRMMIRLEQTQIVLKDEQLRYNPEAEAAVPTGSTDPYARAFTCAWTAQMEETYKSEPIWRDMHNIYRHFAVTRIMRDCDAFRLAGLDPEFLLETYALPRVELPDKLAGSGRVETARHRGTRAIYTYAVCGGVDVGLHKVIRSTPDRDGTTQVAARAALDSRPSQATAAWLIPTAAFGRVVPIVPGPSAPDTKSEPALAHPPTLKNLFDKNTPGPTDPVPPPEKGKFLRDLFKT